MHICTKFLKWVVHNYLSSILKKPQQFKLIKVRNLELERLGFCFILRNNMVPAVTPGK